MAEYSPKSINSSAATSAPSKIEPVHLQQILDIHDNIKQAKSN